MKKNDMIELLRKEREITKNEATEIVDFVFDTMRTGLIEDGLFDFFGFGKFTVEEVPEKTRKYTFGDKKGEEYKTPAYNKVKFKPAKALKDIVNQ